MKIRILGSAAGGGFPQWNCACTNCAGLRNGTLRASARTQSSLAVSDDGGDWVLINASPDIRAQIEAFATLLPKSGPRGTGIRGIVLVDSQIDHTAGLLILREGAPLHLYCTEQVREDLSTGFPVMTMLQHYCGVDWHPIAGGNPFEVDGVEGIVFHPMALSSKAPPYSPHRNAPQPGDNIGLVIEDKRSAGKVFYAPGLGHIDEPVRAAMAAADCLLVDGTCWSDDEMAQRGVGAKRARDMGHLPQSGPGGMLEVLAPYGDKRRILTHINNTNPILIEDSPERALLDEQGIEVAFDGMEISL